MDEFRRVETERLARSEAADLFSFIGRPKGVGRVEEKRNCVFTGNGSECCHVARATPQVHAQYGRGPRTDHLCDLLGVKRVRGRIDVAENGAQTMPRERVGRRDERVSRNNHLANAAQSSDRQLECRGSVARCDAMFDFRFAGHAALEFSDQRTTVR